MFKKLVFTFSVLLGVFTLFSPGSFAKGMYSSGSFNQKISTGANYTRENSIGSIRSVQDNYSIPIYRTSGNEPLVKVFNDYGRVAYWPIPHSAQPNAGSDHSMAIVDRKKQVVYEIWNARWIGNTIHAGSMKDFPLSGDGVSHPANQKVTASGFASTAGAVTKDDVNQGIINHALIVFLPHNLLRKNSFIAPAVGGENHFDNIGSISLGIRLALPRNIDLSGINLSPLSKMIIRAMQDYGAIVSDRSNAQPYKGKYVATFQVEKGITNNSMSNKIQQEMYQVIQKNGLFRVN
jgi:hypothetical protein